MHGAPYLLHGTMNPDGTIALEEKWEIEAAIKSDDADFARTRLLALENTFVLHFGGKLIPYDYIVQATDYITVKTLCTASCFLSIGDARYL